MVKLVCSSLFFFNACKNGDIKIVEKYFDYFENNCQNIKISLVDCLNISCIMGHFDIFKFLTDKGIKFSTLSLWNIILEYFIESFIKDDPVCHGQFKIFRYLSKNNKYLSFCDSNEEFIFNPRNLQFSLVRKQIESYGKFSNEIITTKFYDAMTNMFYKLNL